MLSYSCKLGREDLIDLINTLEMQLRVIKSQKVKVFKAQLQKLRE